VFFLHYSLCICHCGITLFDIAEIFGPGKQGSRSGVSGEKAFFNSLMEQKL